MCTCKNWWKNVPSILNTNFVAELFNAFIRSSNWPITSLHSKARIWALSTFTVAALYGDTEPPNVRKYSGNDTSIHKHINKYVWSYMCTCIWYLLDPVKGTWSPGYPWQWMYCPILKTIQCTTPFFVNNWGQPERALH